MSSLLNLDEESSIFAVKDEKKIVKLHWNKIFFSWNWKLFIYLQHVSLFSSKFWLAPKVIGTFGLQMFRWCYQHSPEVLWLRSHWTISFRAKRHGMLERRRASWQNPLQVLKFRKIKDWQIKYLHSISWPENSKRHTRQKKKKTREMKWINFTDFNFSFSEKIH